MKKKKQKASGGVNVDAPDIGDSLRRFAAETSDKVIGNVSGERFSIDGVDDDQV